MADRAGGAVDERQAAAGGDEQTLQVTADLAHRGDGRAKIERTQQRARGRFMEVQYRAREHAADCVDRGAGGVAPVQPPCLNIAECTTNECKYVLRAIQTAHAATMDKSCSNAGM